MDETSRCGARRALNARERSGDATSGDERRRDERRRDSEARAKPVLRSSTSALLRSSTSLIALRVLAYGLPVTKFSGHALSLTDRPTAVHVGYTKFFYRETARIQTLTLLAQVRLN